jgi:hypothetical protein
MDCRTIERGRRTRASFSSLGEISALSGKNYDWQKSGRPGVVFGVTGEQNAYSLSCPGQEEAMPQSGLEALTDRSRRPWRYGNQLPAQVQTAILNPETGRDGIAGLTEHVGSAARPSTQRSKYVDNYAYKNSNGRHVQSNWEEVEHLAVISDGP